MPRTARGKLKTCKALNLDGTKCLKEFACKRHRSSDHKFCSEKCRKRDYRLKQKKIIQREARAEKKRLKEIKRNEWVVTRLQVEYQHCMNILNELIRINRPVKQIEEKRMSHTDFNGIGGTTRWRTYEDRRVSLEKEERNRQATLERNKSLLIPKLEYYINRFMELMASKELKLVLTDEIRAVAIDRATKIFNGYRRAGETPPPALAVTIFL